MNHLKLHKMNCIIKLFVASFVVFMMVSCSQPSKKIADPTAEEQEIIVARGEAIALKLIQTLKSEVKQAIDSNGVESAIAVCNIRAMPLTREIESSSDGSIEIKRTSFSYRNPDNQPDEFESLALSHFEMLVNQGKELPAAYTQKAIDGNDTTFYFYKPMKMESMCLLCHGDEKTMIPEVKNIISTLYPDDRAKGYKEGDFRGLIRIKWAM
jgi:hypothetical protein